VAVGRALELAAVDGPAAEVDEAADADGAGEHAVTPRLTSTTARNSRRPG
jgi:hypothetical protein